MNPITKVVYLAIQIEKSKEDSKKQLITAVSQTTKIEDFILSQIMHSIEVKFSWIIQDYEGNLTKEKYFNMINMEGNLISQKNYFYFSTAFREWAPQITKFSYACIVYYDIKGNCLVGISTFSETATSLKFPLNTGITSKCLVNNEIITGNIKDFSDYQSDIDNYGCFPEIHDFMFLPLVGKKNTKLGVAQFYNCGNSAISEELKVI